jgi:hypothetical protein
MAVQNSHAFKIVLTVDVLPDPDALIAAARCEQVSRGVPCYRLHLSNKSTTYSRPNPGFARSGHSACVRCVSLAFANEAVCPVCVCRVISKRTLTDLVFMTLQSGDLLVLAVRTRPDDACPIEARSSKFIIARRPRHRAHSSIVCILKNRLANPSPTILPPDPAD